MAPLQAVTPRKSSCRLHSLAKQLPAVSSFCCIIHFENELYRKKSLRKWTFDEIAATLQELFPYLQDVGGWGHHARYISPVTTPPRTLECTQPSVRLCLVVGVTFSSGRNSNGNLDLRQFSCGGVTCRCCEVIGPHHTTPQHSTEEGEALKIQRPDSTAVMSLVYLALNGQRSLPTPLPPPPPLPPLRETGWMSG
ncbi:uncharacterized protein LOC123513886 [Portunus trituberculatus]|uniref:uncharacterized protein LOC123513886 n=1 Tax=Portunus trituberculatus TaxID=210409 RepID=UPI001E1CDAAC|nr:uncharacterized protein LOC123513886 [Portunus trituberculatus]